MADPLTSAQIAATLLGGLGAMGVGEMWFREDDSFRSYEGFETAPERDSAGRLFGTGARSSSVMANISREMAIIKPKGSV